MTPQKGAMVPLEQESVFFCLCLCVYGGPRSRGNIRVVSWSISSPQLAAPCGSPPSSLSSVIPPSFCDTLCRLLQLGRPPPLSLNQPPLDFPLNLSSLSNRLAHLLRDHLLHIDPQPASLPVCRRRIMRVIMKIMALSPVICHAVVLAACTPYTS